MSLEELVEKYGLKAAWLAVLYKHLKSRPDLAYIREQFGVVPPIEKDWLEGLSIGEIGALYEYCLAVDNHEDRKANGQYFTPDDVAQFMADQTRSFPPGKWLDPCCGVGNLSWHLVAAQEDPEGFLMTRLVLADHDELALVTARILLTMAFQDKNPRLYDDIAPNFKARDFLVENPPFHDFVLVNPPYFSTGDSDLYAMFMEKVAVTSRGFVSITPQSFTNAKKFRKLRWLMMGYDNLTIYCFDNVPGNIFKGFKWGSQNSNKANSVRAAITVAKPGPGRQRITSLMRWKSSERERLFAEVEDFLSGVPLTSEFFPKVNSAFEGLYNDLQGCKRLGDLVDKNGEFSLFIPSTPRYFISATQKKLVRSSQHELKFASFSDLDTAYLLINSSLMYWWWRVRDGGMTLSREALLSLPIPEFEHDPLLQWEVELSEDTNKVYKQNAGAPQENVKHPLDLVRRINELVVSDYSEQLLSTHANSEFVQKKFL
jgi:hypothetical protein